MRVLLIDLVPEERAAYAAIARGDLAEGYMSACVARARYAAGGPAWADREARMGRLVAFLEAEAGGAALGAADAGAGERRAAA